MCLCTLGFSSCSDDYDDTELRKDIDNLEDRVTSLEEWQKSVNTDIQSLQSLVAALENRNYITDITPVMENGEETGYTITFQNGNSITIRHGKNGADGKDGANGNDGTNGTDGVTPVIGVLQDTNGTYYWTVNGEYLTDNSGNKVPVTGAKGDKGDKGDKGETGDEGDKGDKGNDGTNAIAPQVRINPDTNIWQVSTDGGSTWENMKDASGNPIKATGEKGDKGDKGETGATGANGNNGDSVFAENGINTTDDPNSVTFTLADGTKFTVPRANKLTVKFADGCDVFSVTPNNNKIQINFTGLTSDNYKALVAELKSEDGTDMDIVTRATGNKEVEITGPDFNKGNATVTINKTNIANGTKAVLKVTLIDNNGQETSVSRIVKLFSSALAEAIDSKNSYVLTEDMVLSQPIEIPEGKEFKLNLNGHTLTYKTAQGATGAQHLFTVENGATLNLDGGKIVVDDTNGVRNTPNGGCYVANVKTGGKINIDGGEYKVQDCTVFQADGGEVIIKGGTFELTEDIPQDWIKYMLNHIDSKKNEGKIVVTGGKFKKYDPEHSKSENPEMNFVDNGYHSLKNGEWYYVVPQEANAVASTTEELTTALASGTTGDEIAIMIPSNSTVSIENDVINGETKKRNVTFIGDGTQTVDIVSKAVTAEGGKLNYQRGSSFTFKKVTIQAGEGNFDGIVCDELTYEDCTIKGKITLYGKATFSGCTFENTMDNQYSIWTWDGTEVKFDGCTFNTNGKAILLYGNPNPSTSLAVTKCIFNDRNNGSAGKAAIEVGNDYAATYSIIAINCTVNGFAKGENTDSKLWANKNNMNQDHLSVTIDGNKVY